MMLARTSTLWRRLTRRIPSSFTSCASFSSTATTSESKEDASAGADASAGPDATEEPDRVAELLEASLPFIDAHGFTDETLRSGAESLGWSPGAISSVPLGAYGLVDYIFTRNNKLMTDAVLADESFSEMRTPDRVRTVVKTRLQLQAPFVSRWHEAIALSAHPSNACTAARNGALLVDEMWALCGDQSVDWNWYTKRALLSSVYVAAEVHMLSDKSDGFRDTWSFVDRRVDDIGMAGQVPAQVLSTVQGAMDIGWNLVQQATQAVPTPVASPPPAAGSQPEADDQTAPPPPSQ